jgi:hypothetical protein
MENPEFVSRFIAYEKALDILPEEKFIPLLEFYHEHGSELPNLDPSQISGKMINFIKKNPHIAEKRNLKRITYAMNHPEITSKESLENLSFAKNKFLNMFTNSLSVDEIL